MRGSERSGSTCLRHDCALQPVLDPSRAADGRRRLDHVENAASVRISDRAPPAIARDVRTSPQRGREGDRGHLDAPACRLPRQAVRLIAASTEPPVQRSGGSVPHRLERSPGRAHAPRRIAHTTLVPASRLQSHSGLRSGLALARGGVLYAHGNSAASPPGVSLDSFAVALFSSRDARRNDECPGKNRTCARGLGSDSGEANGVRRVRSRPLRPDRTRHCVREDAPSPLGSVGSR